MNRNVSFFYCDGGQEAGNFTCIHLQDVLETTLHGRTSSSISAGKEELDEGDYFVGSKAPHH